MDQRPDPQILALFNAYAGGVDPSKFGGYGTTGLGLLIADRLQVCANEMSNLSDSIDKVAGHLDSIDNRLCGIKDAIGDLELSPDVSVDCYPDVTVEGTGGDPGIGEGLASTIDHARRQIVDAIDKATSALGGLGNL